MTGTTTRIMRPGIALALAATLAVGVIAATPAQQATALDPLPSYTYAGVVVDPDTQVYNPTGEFIFPTVFHAGEHFANPLGEWYLYYGPHNQPGGLSLMYSDSLDGPWTQYANNPVVDNDWEPHYTDEETNHVAASDAFWSTAEQKMFLYFHGNNSVERYATTTDGVNFTYGGVAVNTTMVGGVSEVSYARVFDHPNPALGNDYGMFFMVNQGGVRKIRLAVSDNLRTWTVDPDIIVSPVDGDGGNVSAGTLVNWGGQNYVAYHGSTGKIMVRTIDTSLSTVGAPELLYGFGRGGFSSRAAAPEFVSSGGYEYLFYEAGDRLDAKVSYAKRSLPDPARLACAGAGSDDFTGTSLNASRWPTIVRSSLARHTVDGGSLTIPTYGAGVAGAPLIQQPVRTGAWEVTTAVNISPSASYQQAGLLLWATDSTYAKLDLGYGSHGRTIEYIQRKAGSDRNIWLTDTIAAPAAVGERIWLRLTSNGTQVTASYSANGTSFTAVGRPVLLSSVPATKIGPFALRGATSSQEIAGVFDWYQWKPTAAELAAC